MSACQLVRHVPLVDLLVLLGQRRQRSAPRRLVRIERAAWTQRVPLALQVWVFRLGLCGDACRDERCSRREPPDGVSQMHFISLPLLNPPKLFATKCFQQSFSLFVQLL